MPDIISIPKEGLSSTDKTMIRIGAYTLGTLGLVSFLWWLGKKDIHKRKAAKANKLTLDDGSVESYANRLQMAFEHDGIWGTDVPAVRQVFIEIPNKNTFSLVASKFKDLAGKDLYAELEDELTTSEHYEMTQILSAKPEKAGQPNYFDMKAAKAMAKRIKAAFDYTILGLPATDKGALKAALDEIPSQYGFALVKANYEVMYGGTLEDDLNSELDIFDFSWKDIVFSKSQR